MRSWTYDDIVIKAYCRNEMVNSVLSTYNTRFEEQKIPGIQVVGEKLPCSGNDVLCDPVECTGKCHACGTGAAGEQMD